MRESRDIGFGLLAVVLAGAYWHAADNLQRSFLSDNVGADGVPKLLAVTLGVLGAVVVAREFAARRAAVRGEASSANVRAHVRALGLLAACVLYVVAMPTVGYLIATAALIGGVALYAGESVGRAVLIAAAAGSVLLWFVFDHLLGVSLPPGTWLHALA